MCTPEAKNKKPSIVRLKKSEWKGFILPVEYTFSEYYDVKIKADTSGFTAVFERKAFSVPVKHSPEAYDYPDRLFAPHWPGASAYGIFDEGSLTGAIEIYPEKWSDRLRVTELWCSEKYRKRGRGKALMDKAKEYAVKHGFRMIILETQSCNVNAIDFYLSQGFRLAGFDAYCYSNHDIENKEVRVELGWINRNSDSQKV